jgi:hypothetical protein
MEYLPEGSRHHNTPKRSFIAIRGAPLLTPETPAKISQSDG